MTTIDAVDEAPKDAPSGVPDPHDVWTLAGLCALPLIGAAVVAAVVELTMRLL